MISEIESNAYIHIQSVSLIFMRPLKKYFIFHFIYKMKILVAISFRKFFLIIHETKGSKKLSHILSPTANEQNYFLFLSSLKHINRAQRIWGSNKLPPLNC